MQEEVHVDVCGGWKAVLGEKCSLIGSLFCGEKKQSQRLAVAFNQWSKLEYKPIF